LSYSKVRDRAIFYQENQENEGKHRHLLDEKIKKWYDSSMDKYTEINEKIAKNLIYYRKSAGYTQAELAEKIKYSDKSISKWESGNGVPDIYILLELAKLYKISLNDLVGEEPPKMQESEATNRKIFSARLLILLLSVGIVWLVATFAFVVMKLINENGNWWIFFLYAVPCSAILCIVLSGIWRYRLINFTATSILVWSVLTCVYVSLFAYGDITMVGEGSYKGYWMLFLLGIPLQALEILWVFFRSFLKKGRKKSETPFAETEENDQVEKE
jgi:transcriptional regulator with XRE-family HTH domain